MDFTLSDEQAMVRDTARTLLAKECPPSLLRAVIDDRTAAAPLWERLREWVVLGERDLVDHCLVLEETGAVGAPGPYLATSALYVPLLRAAGLAGGDGDGVASAGTVAWAGPDGVWGGAADSPVRTFVLDLDLCDRVAVVLPGPSVAELDASEVSATARPFEWVDLTRRAYEVDVPPGAAAAATPVDAVALDGALARATVAVAAELVGTARWLLQASVGHARERVQFDRPIGSFQAVQHKLADMALDIERATAAVYYAAMTVDAGDPDAERAVHVAKAAAGTAARRAAKDGIQIHGGVGYTWEHDLHLFLRRAVTGERLLGTTAWHHDRLADLLL